MANWLIVMSFIVSAKYLRGKRIQRKGKKSGHKRKVTTRASVRRTILISPLDSYKAREHKEKDIEMVLRPRSACVDRPLLRSTDNVYVCSRRRNNVEKGRREKMRQMGS